MREYAEWAGLEKTAHWHAGLAWIMMDGNYFDAAIAELKKALEMDSMAWVAQEGISRCYESLDEVHLAMEWITKAIENVPVNLSSLVPQRLLPQVATLWGKIRYFERAIKAWKEVWESNVYAMDHLKSYIRELHRAGQHQDLVDLVMQINGWTSDHEHCENFLVLFLISSHDKPHAFDAIGTAINTVDDSNARGTFLRACDFAITSADNIQAKADNPVPCTQIRINVAFFKYSFCDQTAEAITLWHQTLDLVNAYAASGGRLLLNARKECTNALCQIYFDSAVEANDRGEDPGQWVSLLKDRARFSLGVDLANEGGHWVSGTGYASIIYGSWLRNHGGAEEEVWRECFQAAVAQGLDMLVDDDPVNDQVA